MADYIATAPLVVVEQLDGTQSHTYAGQAFTADVTKERVAGLVASGALAAVRRPAPRGKGKADAEGEADPAPVAPAAAPLATA